MDRKILGDPFFHSVAAEIRVRAMASLNFTAFATRYSCDDLHQIEFCLLQIALIIVIDAARSLADTPSPDQPACRRCLEIERLDFTGAPAATAPLAITPFDNVNTVLLDERSRL